MDNKEILNRLSEAMGYSIEDAQKNVDAMLKDNVSHSEVDVFKTNMRTRLGIISGTGAMPEPETDLDGVGIMDIMKEFSVSDALKMCYVPLVISQAAYRFATLICDQCAREQLDYRKQTRILRECAKSYAVDVIGSDKRKLVDALDNELTGWMDNEQHDITTLYFCVNQELKKQYPELSEYDMLTYIYMSLALLGYVKFMDIQYDKEISQLLHRPYHTGENHHNIKARKALSEIAGYCKIDLDTEMISRAIKVIGIKMDTFSFSDHQQTEEANDE